MTKVLAALILAKAGSNRLPNKNILDFHGKPMFLVNVEKCLRIFNRVYVSSDSREMLAQAEAMGARGILRGTELCGETPNIPVYQHALKYMGEVEGIVAVQANSPTVDSNLIGLTKKIMECGVGEVMTCHPDYSLYGSIWAVSREVLVNYKDAYDRHPDVLLLDTSVDIHTKADYTKALQQHAK